LQLLTNESSRAVVVNLWDVTDKDIDRFSISLLKRWGLLSNTTTTSSSSTDSKSKGKSHANKFTSSEHDNLGTAVAMSRSECTLRYLVGAAPVVYGMPHMMVMSF
jgi:separase